MSIFVVVANQFHEFSKNGDVLAYDVLLDMLTHSDEALRGTKVIAGQGLEAKQMRHAHQLAIAQGYHAEFTHWHLWGDVAPAGRDLSHKHRPENVLISVPEKNTDGSYCAQLLLHPDNELMLDHLTGQHVQGMVLLEACRQMFLAVTERFHLEEFSALQRYFVLNQMSVHYTAFAFPLPAEIRYRMLNSENPRPDRLDVTAEMEVWQTNKIVTSVGVNFTVMDGERLTVRESSLATRAVYDHAELMRKDLGTVATEDSMTEPISQM